MNLQNAVSGARLLLHGLESIFSEARESGCQVQSSEAIVSVTLLSNSEKRKTEAVTIKLRRLLVKLTARGYAGNRRILRKKIRLITTVRAPG